MVLSGFATKLAFLLITTHLDAIRNARTTDGQLRKVLAVADPVTRFFNNQIDPPTTTSNNNNNNQQQQQQQQQQEEQQQQGGRSLKTATMRREFSFQGFELPDPNPQMSVEDVRGVLPGIAVPGDPNSQAGGDRIRG